MRVGPDSSTLGAACDLCAWSLQVRYVFNKEMLKITANLKLRQREQFLQSLRERFDSELFLLGVGRDNRPQSHLQHGAKIHRQNKTIRSIK
jgi:hypothetical protein